MAVSINGQSNPAVPINGYVSVPGRWKNGDIIDVTLPMSLHFVPMPDNKDRIALMYGPLVLAGQLGTDGLAPPVPYAHGDQNAYAAVPDPPVPVFVTDKPSSSWMKPVAGAPLTWRTEGIGVPHEVTLKPFYQTSDCRYTVYFDTFTSADWKQRQKNYEAARQQQRERDARTVDDFKPGEPQSERDHNLQGEKSASGVGPSVEDSGITHWRDASDGGGFTFTLKCLPSAPVALLCTYWGSDSGSRVFDIRVDGAKIATEALTASHPGAYFDVPYLLPAALTAGKLSITVRFQAHPGAAAGGLFQCRLVRQ